MKRATREYLAEVAKDRALAPFHGAVDGLETSLGPVVSSFPSWRPEEADGVWCAAFVYYCCKEAGFEIPVRPDECRTCHLGGCIAWEEFAQGDPRIEYHRGGEGFVLEAGDIVLYDRVFENREHDHIGIVLERRERSILAAEGNVNNRSAIVERPADEHIRAYIRIPDGYRYRDRAVEFRSLADFPRGTLYDILSDAYSYDQRNRQIWDADWKQTDDFFYNNPEIAAGYSLVTCLDGEPIGFVTWDPRHRPDYVEIGHNGIREKYKGRGYGRLQLMEALRRIKEYEELKRIIVGTNSNLVAPRNYESAGFTLYDRKPNDTESAYTGDYLWYELIP